MRINGYKLQHILADLKQEREMLTALFDKETRAYPSEKAGDPMAVSENLEKCEAEIVHIQEVQSGYNREVRIELGGKPFSLSAAVKLAGGLGRIEGMWRKLVGEISSSHRNRYSEGLESRVKDREEVQVFTVSLDVAKKKLREATKMTRECKEAVAGGNGQMIEIGDDPVVARLLG
jgi:hypothetical protein